jgi:hypothetical protein
MDGDRDVGWSAVNALVRGYDTVLGTHTASGEGADQGRDTVLGTDSWDPV